MSDWLEQLSELEQQATRHWIAIPGITRSVFRTDEDGEQRLLADLKNVAHVDAELIVALRNSATNLIELARRAYELERENEQLRQREKEQRKQLNYIESYCSDYVDDITTSHKMIRNICEVIGMDWEKRI